MMGAVNLVVTLGSAALPGAGQAATAGMGKSGGVLKRHDTGVARRGERC